MEAPTLKATLRKMSRGRAFVCFAVLIFTAFAFFVALSRRNEELRITSLGQAAARAFRPSILQGATRDAQEQIRLALGMGESEVVVIRGPDYEELYSSDGSIHPSSCRSAKKACWESLGRLTYLEPILFNPKDPKSVYGYVELTVVPKLDYVMAGFFVFALLLIGLIAAYFISSGVSRSAIVIDRTLKHWSNQLRGATQDFRTVPTPVPYREFQESGALIDSLYREVEVSRRRTANEANIGGQLSMLRGVSHDLKTPLSQIRKFHEVLLARYARSGTLDLEASQEMKFAVERVSSLLREIQNAIQPPEKIEIYPATDIRVQAENYVRALKSEPDFIEKGIRILIEGKEGSYPAGISGVQFYRVLDNLVRNAVDALEGRAGNIEITFGNYASRPVMFVSDNGVGVDPANAEKIFSPDFSTKASRGTGLGLSVVKSILQMVGGEIAFESNLGGGTCFRVRFDAPKPAELIQEVQV